MSTLKVPLDNNSCKEDDDDKELIDMFRTSTDFVEFMARPEIKNSLYGKQILQDGDDTVIKRFLKANANAAEDANMEDEANDISSKERIIIESMKAFSKMMQWRLDNDVDNALKTWTFDIDKIKKLYPHKFHHFDKSGRPVYWEQLGKIDVNGLSAVASVDVLAKYHIYHWEYITQVMFPLVSKQRGSRVEQIITICDVSGISPWQLSPSVLSLLGKIGEIDQYFYPETGFKLFLVNPPWLFGMIWSVISPFMHSRGQNKIETVYGSPGSVLLNHIDAKHLPKSLGGEGNDDELTEEEKTYRSVCTGTCKVEFMIE